jgi:hypothetical protein
VQVQLQAAAPPAQSASALVLLLLLILLHCTIHLLHCRQHPPPVCSCSTVHGNVNRMMLLLVHPAYPHCMTIQHQSLCSITPYGTKHPHHAVPHADCAVLHPNALDAQLMS